MTNYQELLQNEQWILKRKEILQRDRNCCQRCRNEEVLVGAEKGELVKIILEDNRLLALLNADDPRFRPHQPKYSVEYYDSSRIVQKTHIYLLEWLEQEALDSLKGVPLYYSMELSNEGDSKMAVRAILKVADGVEYFHINNLHVHHNYYQEGRKPWEYPDTALVTLCWKCHENLHKNETVPCLDKSGKQIKTLTPCFRCFGAGYFPEFYHVQKGICFRCNGAKFEEFIFS